MSQELESILLSFAIIILGVMLRKNLIPRSGNFRKYWWVFILLGSLNILFRLMIFLI